MKKNVVLSLCLFLCLATLENQVAGQSKIVRGTAKANGITMAYERIGPQNGEAILLVQGTGMQLIGWPLELCERLAKAGYNVIRYDNRDVGLSTKLDSLGMPDWATIIPNIGTCNDAKLPYTMSDMAKDAVGLLSALKIQKAHIVGASMGGAIAQLVAINYPERVLSLTSIMASSGSPTLPQGDPEVRKIMATPPPNTNDVDILANQVLKISKVIGSPGYPTPDSVILERARASIKRSWYPAGFARHVAAIIIADNCDRREKLRKITAPTVVIHGENDPVVNVAAAREIASSVPGAKLITLPGMGHDLPTPLIPRVCDEILSAASRGKK